MSGGTVHGGGLTELIRARGWCGLWSNSGFLLWRAVGTGPVSELPRALFLHVKLGGNSEFEDELKHHWRRVSLYPGSAAAMLSMQPRARFNMPPRSGHALPLGKLLSSSPTASRGVPRRRSHPMPPELSPAPGPIASHTVGLGANFHSSREHARCSLVRSADRLAHG